MHEYYAICHQNDGFSLYYIASFAKSRTPISLKTDGESQYSCAELIEDRYICIDKRKIPKDFKSDACWKKRGL